MMNALIADAAFEVPRRGASQFDGKAALLLEDARGYQGFGFRRRPPVLRSVVGPVGQAADCARGHSEPRDEGQVVVVGGIELCTPRDTKHLLDNRLHHA